MASETELVDLLGAIGDRAPRAEAVRNRLTVLAPVAPVAPTTRSRTRWLAVVAAVSTAAAAVVASVVLRGDGRASTGPAAAPPAPTVDHATYPLPLDRYYASAAQERTLQQAQFALTQRCAARRGVTVPAAHFRNADPAEDFLGDVANDVRPLTVQQARTIGYDLYPSGRSAFDAALAGLTPQQLETVQGWSAGSRLTKPTDRFLLEGGCFGQAERTLLLGASPTPLPGVRSSDGLPGLFTDDIYVQDTFLNQARFGERTAPVRLAQRRWSSCMAAHGYPGLRSTDAAIQGIGELNSARARVQAMQDVRCKQSTGFMTVWIASITLAQRAVVAEHRMALAGFHQRLMIRLANAAKALK